MKRKTLATTIKNFKLEHYDTADRKELKDDHGVQFAKRKGELTLATSYYWRHQGSTDRLMDEFVTWMREHGWEITPVNTPHHEVRAYKTSWCRQVYTAKPIQVIAFDEDAEIKYITVDGKYNHGVRGMVSDLDSWSQLFVSDTCDPQRFHTVVMSFDGLAHNQKCIEKAQRITRLILDEDFVKLEEERITY